MKVLWLWLWNWGQQTSAPYFSSSDCVDHYYRNDYDGSLKYLGRTKRRQRPNRTSCTEEFCGSMDCLIYVVVIILGVSGLLIFTVSNNFLILAAFAACMIIFVFPLFLLGTVTPSLAKYTVDSLEDNGKIVGTLGAFNTIGSIIGTFLPTFVTIPVVGTAVTFLIFSGVLLVLALIYFFQTGKKKRSCAAALVVFLLCAVLGNRSHFAFWEQDLLYEGESVYNYLQVKKTEENVVLSTNVLFGVQSVMQKEKGLTGMYYDTAMAAPLMADTGEKEKLEVLILGMGSGTYARQCQAYFHNLSMEGVEIDEKITDLPEYFDLPQNVNVTTMTEELSSGSG
ncbi:MAG: fused MFS/spermidine synthase [Blautia faecis]